MNCERNSGESTTIGLQNIRAMSASHDGLHLQHMPEKLVKHVRWSSCILTWVCFQCPACLHKTAWKLCSKRHQLEQTGLPFRHHV